jgi:PiT family inorganic phosphate transporter
MVLLLNAFARAFPATVTRIFGRAQLLSAAYMAYSHGSNDAQKTMGVMTMAVASYEHWGGSNWQVPVWIIGMAAVAMGLGTSVGGWRIIRTMGLRVVQLRPINGFAAETAAATVIEAASRLGIPVSTTHTIGSAILGVGATRRLSAVRWGMAGQIVMGWILTIPGCFLLAWAVKTVLSLAGA